MKVRFRVSLFGEEVADSVVQSSNSFRSRFIATLRSFVNSMIRLNVRPARVALLRHD